ncbi:MAG TPA: type II toxin-antitoxin system RelE/ParE family toxin [Candidatus Ozemobacteraceae bacterium]|nr:type II toxin-antitoxin system RelE/ParE family toxin [Candidatus Ozemobacteraceae bacterium]
MTAFLVELTSQAAKDLKRLSRIEDEILEHLRKLQEDHEKGHALTQNLQGARALEFSVKGSGAYRAAYIVQEDAEKVTVFLIGAHENFYAEAGRRAKLIKSLMNKARVTSREKSRKKSK